MLCVINEPKRIFGNALIAKKWREVLKRKEYDPFRTKAIYIIMLAEKYAMYCPNIFIESGVMCIFYTNDDRYVKFTILGDEIKCDVGTKNKEDYFFELTNKFKMIQLSDYLYEDYINIQK